MAASKAHVSLTTVHTTFWAEWQVCEEKRTRSICSCPPSEPRTISQEAQLIPRRKRCAQCTTPGAFHVCLANPRLQVFSPQQLRTVADRVGDRWNREMAASNAHVSLTTVHANMGGG